MPRIENGRVYGLPADAHIGQTMTIDGTAFTVSDWRRRGTFDGRGFDEYTLTTAAGDTLPGYH